MSVKQALSKIHLILGLGSGAVVFIIAVTGCIYCFQQELQDMTQPYRFVNHSSGTVLPPSKLLSVAEDVLPGKHVHAVYYPGAHRAVQVIFFDFEPEYYYFVAYLNPYDGKLLHVEDMTTNFFQIVLDGHFYLWLPPEIGQPVTASATLIFIVLLVSGLLLWWIKSKGSAKQRFTIKWRSRWRRKNYDLHRVFGFYVMAIGIVLAVTGLVWGFQWFAKSYYFAAGGEKSLVYVDPSSNTSKKVVAEVPAVDAVFSRMMEWYPRTNAIEIHTPESDSSSIAANANPEPGTYYRTDYRYFDQYTLEELSVEHIYGRYSEATHADKLMRMNYDIHVGAIFGFPGKVLMFLASLVCASLPVTGTLLWWGRRNKAKKDNGEANKRNGRSDNRRAVIATRKDSRRYQEGLNELVTDR